MPIPLPTYTHSEETLLVVLSPAHRMGKGLPFQVTVASHIWWIGPFFCAIE